MNPFFAELWNVTICNKTLGTYAFEAYVRNFEPAHENADT